jgi:hypothetical protein
MSNEFEDIFAQLPEVNQDKEDLIEKVMEIFRANNTTESEESMRKRAYWTATLYFNMKEAEKNGTLF